MVKYIKTIKNTQKSLNFTKNLFFCDFETIIHSSQHYVTCYSIVYYSKKESEIKFKNRIIDVFDQHFNLIDASNVLLTSFFKDIFELSTTTDSNLIYFHNLSKFDGIFLVHHFIKLNGLKMEIITRENTIYEIVFKDKNNKRIKIRDSFLLFPSSLDKMAKTFLAQGKLCYQKHNAILSDYLNPEFRDSLIKYCLNDALILAKSFKKYREMIFDNFQIDILSCITLPSLAFKIFRSKYYTKPVIQQSHGHMDLFIRKSYRGGVVDVYKPKIEKGYYYDVNSLYPYIMSNNHMPVGVGVFGNAQLEKNFDINDFFGFIYVKIKCPDSLYIPFLTTNDPKYGLISPVGEWKDIYFSEEIKYALTLGYSFEYLAYYKFDKQIIFDKYVTDIYTKRLLHKDKKDLSSILKLLLNSLYGRFGMSNSIYKNLLLKNPDDTKYLNQLNLIYDVEKVNHFENGNIEMNLIRFNEVPNLAHIKKLYTFNLIDDSLYNQLLKESETKTSDLNIAVQISSAITAYSRIYMHKIKNKYAKNLYYSDTDSLITDIQLEEQLISETKLGLLKLEHKIISGLFIAPKLYSFKTDTQGILKVKGINSSLLTHEDFVKLYEGKHIKINVFKNFLRNLKNYTIGVSNKDIELSGLFNKRHKIIKNNIWIDTKPIKI
jgi:hypothetical protein